jgi:4-diphosphocytidyl-2-C-methyl-D-erythritol kinase
LTRNTRPITIYKFILGKGRNDCEPVVRARYPEVRKALEWLAQWGNARMSGTGSCVFARYETEAEASKSLVSLPQRWKGFVARGLNRSPLLDSEDEVGDV